MIPNASPTPRSLARRTPTRAVSQTRRFDSDAFSTALFTSLNIGVFLVLAASVAAATLLYSQGI